MEANNNHIDLIEKYLSNDLSVEEQQTFDQKVHTDSEFAHEFEKRQAAHIAIDFLIAESLKSELEALEEEEEQGGKVISLQKRKRNRMDLLSLAASLLLLIGYFSLVNTSGDLGSTGPQLAAANYEAPDYNIRRGNPTVDFEDLLTKGISALKQRNYQAAITTLDSVAQSNEYYVIAQFYLAHAYYQAEQYTEAEVAFDLVSASNDIRYQEDADWYSLLACLAKEGNCTEKIDRLADDNGHSYQQQVISIRDGLQN